jgi:hypothetical protein
MAFVPKAMKGDEVLVGISVFGIAEKVTLLRPNR